MTIQLESILADDSWNQWQGRQLGGKLKTEEAAESAQRGVLKRRGVAGRLVLLQLLLFGAVLGMAGTVPSQYLRPFWCIPPLLCISLVISAAVWKDLSDKAYLHAPLASKPTLCAQLMALTECSPAVRGYVSGVNSTGRQLRVFDVACANEVFNGEQYQLTQRYEQTGCLTLHSL